MDFAETVYWNAGVKTDASTGLATLSFNLSDSVTSFRVLADGFTQDGTLGSGVSDVEDKSWYYDRAFWRSYLTNLATNRFNRSTSGCAGASRTSRA